MFLFRYFIKNFYDDVLLFSFFYKASNIYCVTWFILIFSNRDTFKEWSVPETKDDTNPKKLNFDISSSLISTIEKAKRKLDEWVRKGIFDVIK